MARKPRIEQRLERAEATCRELRYAIANPWDADWDGVVVLMLHWMKIAPRSKYVRPMAPRKRVEPAPDSRGEG